MSTYRERASLIWGVADDLLRSYFKAYEYGNTIPTTSPQTVQMIDIAAQLVKAILVVACKC